VVADRNQSQEDLFERANRAIAESERLVALLQSSIQKARQLDDRLRDLHWLRIQEERMRASVCLAKPVRDLPVHGRDLAAVNDPSYR
jgi:hypothetical protein